MLLTFGPEAGMRLAIARHGEEEVGALSVRLTAAMRVYNKHKREALEE